MIMINSTYSQVLLVFVESRFDAHVEPYLHPKKINAEYYTND